MSNLGLDRFTIRKRGKYIELHDSVLNKNVKVDPETYRNIHSNGMLGSRGYIEVKIDALNEWIRMNQDSFDEYENRIRDGEDIIPYQSLDMRRQGAVRFGRSEEIIKDIEKRRQYDRKINSIRRSGRDSMNFDLSSDIDYFKMKKGDTANDYLIDQDPNLVEHLKNIVRIRQRIDEEIDRYPDNVNDTKFVFCPYVPNVVLYTDVSIESHNKYHNIMIVNNEEFVSYLQSVVESQDLAQLLFEFNNIFYYYDHMLANISEYIGKTVTRDNLFDVILQYEKKRIYGMEKRDIARRLKIRDRKLRAYQNVSCEVPEDRDPLQIYYDQLLGSEKIEEHSGVEYIQKCDASSIDISSLVNNDIRDLEDNEHIYDTCKTMKFSPLDTYKGRSYQTKCGNLVDRIKNSTVKERLKAEPFTDKKSTRCQDFSDRESMDGFYLFEEYMPEWHEAVYNGDLERAFDHRQLLLGSVDDTYYFRECTLICRSDPFISSDCYLPGLIHDIEFNKVVVSCIAGKDDTFPIRIMNGKLLETINMYEPFVKTDDDKLLGSLSIRAKGERTYDNYRYYNSYLYYNKNKKHKITPVNFRSNVMIPGTVIEHVRILYLEMNTLMYYSKDMGVDLHFYKIEYKQDDEENFDILVSKYTMDQIRERYESIESISDADTYLNRLKEVRIEKDFDKRFKFIEIGQIGGSNESRTSNDMVEGYRYDFKCLGRDSYKWNIQTDNTPVIFDREVFSVSLHLELIKLVDRFVDIAGKEVYNTKCMPITYLRSTTTPAVGKFQINKIRKIWKTEGIDKKDTAGKIYENRLKSMDKGEPILSFTPETGLSNYIYLELNRLKPGPDTSYLFFAKNHLLLDGLIWYSKSVLLKDITKNITYYLYKYNYEPYDKIENYLDTYKIRPTTIDSPMNNEWIENNYTGKSEEMVDYAFVDIVIAIPDSANVRYVYALQSEISPIILSLKRLKQGGKMIMFINLIPNKLTFNLISYLSCFFEQTYIPDFSESDMYGASQLIFSFLVFYGFKGMDESSMDRLMELNRRMYELDETGGYRFGVTDPEIKKTFRLEDTDREFASQYVTNILDIDSPEIESEYSRYKEYTKMKFLGYIRNFTQRMDIFLNRDDREKIEEYCNRSKILAIYLAKKYDLPLLDWVESIPKEYFDRMVEDYFENINYTYRKALTGIGTKIGEELNLSVSDSVRCDYCTKLEDNYKISELAYLYVEKINYDRYKSIELFVNNKYKDLNRMIKQEYDITINGKYVSRAWIKFYELLSDTKLLEGFENIDELKVFHICEAPGNFINSMDYYTKKKTNIKTVNWTAQSLSEAMSDIYDHYGFIKATRDRWDMGPKETGDIMDKQNMEYYLEKYSGVHFLIGDCGEAWGGAVSDYKNLTIYQMLYAMLIPQTGGGFVIKSYAGNYNKLYMSLLYFACYQYEEVQIFKSNTNFWSHEVYIVGKNKRNMSEDNKRVILECLSNLYYKKTIYPIAELPDSFIQEYDKIVLDVVSQVSNIKKFFVFLSTNDEFYKLNKSAISEIIKEKNSGWLDKYLRGKRNQNI